jgi:hypothetical protein
LNGNSVGKVGRFPRAAVHRGGGGGTVLLTFYNDESPAPDLDAIMIE